MNDKTDTSRVVSIVAVILAVGLIAGYLLSLWVLRENVKDDETAWSRLVFLLSGLEAIVFTAAGFLFGHIPSRAAIDSSNEVAKTATENAQKAAAEAKVATGKTLEIEARVLGLPSGVQGTTAPFASSVDAGVLLATEVQNLKAEIAKKK